MPGMFDLPDPPSTPAQRLRMSLAMYEDGLAIEREKLRRQHPDADDETIGRLLAAWLQHRPGALLGDADGVPRNWKPEC